MIKLPPHLQEIVDRVKAQEAKFGFTMQEFSCDQIFEMQDKLKQERKNKGK